MTILKRRLCQTPSILGLTLILTTNDVLPILFRFWPLCWLENRGLCFLDSKPVLQLVFDPKHPRNHDNPIHVLKKPKISPRNKKSTRTQICFFKNFKGTKTHNMNYMHQMKQFDTKIFYFDGLNRC